MATYLRQLYYLLYKNIIFKYRHKRQALIEVVAVCFLSVLVGFFWNIAKATQLTYDVIPSSKQRIYNAGEIPGWKRHHLAYVTNVNAS